MCTKSDLDQYLGSVYISVNLFKKSMDNLRPNDHTSIVEFASFLYQMHSYCSRQIKLNKLIHHFESDLIEESLSRKKIEFLRLSLDVYKKASKPINKPVVNETEKPKQSDTEAETTQADEDKVVNVEDDSVSSFDKSNSNKAPTSAATRLAAKTNSTKSDSKNPQATSGEDENNEEEWLYHYMFGKIKEKLGYDLIECLEHYKLSYEHLERNGATILKKCTYKSKSCLYIETNEVFYRMYALTLKRIQKIALKPNSESQLQRISAFLENLTETSFVKSHEDFELETVSMFLQERIFEKSSRLLNIEETDLFINCICLCIAGLFQVLKRFSQHYRSLYRLAHFYSKFLDFRVSFEMI